MYLVGMDWYIMYRMYIHEYLIYLVNVSMCMMCRVVSVDWYVMYRMYTREYLLCLVCRYGLVHDV